MACFLCKLKRIFRLPLLNVENSFKVAMVYKFLFLAFMGYMVCHKYMENNHFDINIRLCYWYLSELVCSWNWCIVGILKLFIEHFQRKSVPECVYTICFVHFQSFFLFTWKFQIEFFLRQFTHLILSVAFFHVCGKLSLYSYPSIVRCKV